MSSPVAAAPPPTTSQATRVAQKNYWLLAGGTFSVAFAIFQITCIWWSKELLQWFGGPVPLMEQHFWQYVGLCVGFGVLAAAMGAYALSGAGAIRRIPFLRTGVIVVSVIYMLRGILAILQVPMVMRNPDLTRYLWFSIIALAVGVVHVIGLMQLYRRGRPGD